MQAITNIASFRNSWRELNSRQKREAKAEIMERIGLVTEPAFYRRVNGDQELTIGEFFIIQEVMMKHGIKKTKIWDNL